MVNLTRSQRVALRNLHLRTLQTQASNICFELEQAQPDDLRRVLQEIKRWPTPVAYRTFRRTVAQGFDCVMIHMHGMWHGIEADGHTHT